MDQRRKTYLIISISVLALLGLGALITRGFLFPKPTIRSIEPQIAAPGDVMVIYGLGFGDIGPESSLYINDLKITNSQIIEWDNRQISLIIPDGVESGPVEVHNRGEISNFRLFTSEYSIPRLSLEQGVEVQELQVQSLIVRPEQLVDLINIPEPKHNNFQLMLPSVFSKEEHLPLSRSADFSYKSLSSEISFPWPSWSREGEIWITYPNKQDLSHDSLMVKLTMERAGSVSLADSARYSLEFSIDQGQIPSMEEAGFLDTQGSEFLLKIPSPVQTDWSYTSSMKVFLGDQELESYGSDEVLTGFMVSRENLAQLSSLKLILEITVFPASVILEIEDMPYSYDGYEHLLYRFTDTTISEEHYDENWNYVQEVIENTRHPSTHVKRLYTAIADLHEPIYLASFQNSIFSFDSNRRNAFSYSAQLLAWYRMLRIPSRLVSGYLKIGEKVFIPHFWLEIFYPNFGWFSIDVAMGDGLYALIEGYPEEAFTFYRGDMDGLHIPLHYHEDIYWDMLQDESLPYLKDQFFSQYILIEAPDKNFVVPLELSDLDLMN